MSAAIIPGEGLNHTLMLGNSLYVTVNRLKELNQPLKIAYASQSFLDTPILVTLPKLGVRLMFESSRNQELVLIEVLNFDHMKLTYNGDLLNDIVYTTPSNEELVGSSDILGLTDRKQVLPPKLKEIYNKIFGPTYPGVLNLEKKTYVLSYPGVSFKFRLELRELLAKVAHLSDKNDILSKLTNWDRAHDIPCESVAIFKGEDYYDFHRKLRAISRKYVAPPAKKATQLSIEKVSVNLEEGTAEFKFLAENETPQAKITIGETTQQDILRLLGPPDAYFNKFDSRLLIHKHLKTVSNETENSGSVQKFHNYFRHGIDFLYNLNPPLQGGGILEKIIFHNGGIAESLDFMQWNKCNWEISAHRHNEVMTVDSLMYFDEFSSDFLDAIKNDKAGPVLLNRNESEITNDEDLEIIQVGELDKQVLFTQSSELLDSKPSNEFKTWGQLKLYGYNRCIWEVLETNNCVSTVTVYK
ncbi:CIC11C00000003651 [Sungouiella intermedia]|uniref:CIC11C00000003651 n=1 Tax=Sungouiella intermedia TaxID=45354 RepID=A0A1L0G3N9_9ASCO|nr:CIC11C00000003651 [[Candida] intermedia]